MLYCIRLERIKSAPATRYTTRKGEKHKSRNAVCGREINAKISAKFTRVAAPASANCSISVHINNIFREKLNGECGALSAATVGTHSGQRSKTDSFSVHNTNQVCVQEREHFLSSTACSTGAHANRVRLETISQLRWSVFEARFQSLTPERETTREHGLARFITQHKM